MLSHFLLVAGTTLHAIAYTLAAVYAHLTDRNRDMCPFYTLIAFATLLKMLVALIQWMQNTRNDSNDRPSGDHRAPIPNARRITYYDDRGEPFFTEWQILPEPQVVAGNPPPTDEPKAT